MVLALVNGLVLIVQFIDRELICSKIVVTRSMYKSLHFFQFLKIIIHIHNAQNSQHDMVQTKSLYIQLLSIFFL